MRVFLRDRQLNRFAAGIVAVLFVLSLFVVDVSAKALALSPVRGQLTSHFGWRTDPFHGGKRFHHGIDIGAPNGAAIRATQKGIVSYSGRYRGYGNVVVIYHGNDLYTLYGHTAKRYVKRGDRVNRGQVIASVGSSGRSTGPHLHFEVHRNKKYTNPVTYLSWLKKQGYKPVQSGPVVPTISITQGGAQSPKVIQPIKTTSQFGMGGGVTYASQAKKGSKQRIKAGKTVEVVQGNKVKTVKF